MSLILRALTAFYELIKGFLPQLGIALGFIVDKAADVFPQYFKVLYRFLNKYGSLVVFTTFFLFFMNFTAPLLAFTLYHICMGWTLFGSLFLAKTTVALVIYAYSSFFVLSIGSLVYRLFKSD